MSKKQLSPLNRFWLLIKVDQKEIRNIYVYAVFAGLLSLTLPVGIQAIINLIQGGDVSTSLVVLILFVILGIIFTGILQVAQLKITEHLQQKIFTRAAFEFAYRTLRFKQEILNKYYAPELMNRFFDITMIQKVLPKVLIDFSTASIRIIFGLILLSLYHPFFIAYSILLIILVYFIFKFTYQKGLETSLRESKSKYNLVHWLQEVARTNISFKLAGFTNLPLEKVDKYSASYIKAREDHFKILVTQYALLITFKVLIAAGLLIAGSFFVIDQRMNIGQFVAAELIILMILGAVEKLILSLENVYDLLTSLEKVGQVTDIPIESNKGIDISESINTKGITVELKNVTFQYPENPKIILNDVSIVIKPNEHIMVTGDLDSGKTSLLFILSGLYSINRGSILYNDMPLINLNLPKLRSFIGECLMDELLFDGTILENITLGREKATLENVQWAIENLGLTDYIKSLPNGILTEIRSEGKFLPNSVFDKIILARAVADKPKLLLIKDAFYSFNKDEGESIMNFITDKANGWTLVAVSKDERLKSKVDRILFMSKGKIKTIS
jgi:ABC-type bacteriocin/lantibiotic exporter with double-glycine peptidase domain